MAITRIKNNQITDLAVNAASKLQDFSITSGKIANNLTYGSDLTVAGNLTVSGSTTTVETTNLSVEDALLLFASGQTGSPTVDVGFLGERGDQENVAFVWDESEGKFVAAFTNSSETDETVVVSEYADMQVADLVADDVQVAGNIDITGDMSLGGNVDSLDVTGNVAGGNLVTTGTTDTGSLTASTTIDANGNITGGNLVTSGSTDTGSLTSSTTVTAIGNIDGGNITTDGVVDATGSVIAGNLTTEGTTQTGSLSANTTITATGNVSGGNLTTSGELDATGNVSGGNITIGGVVDATGNVSGGNLNTSGTTQTGSLSANTTVSATGNVSGGNITTAGVVDATGNVSGGNLVTGGALDADTVSAANSITAGTTVTATGNVSGGNITTDGIVDATGNVTGGNLNTAGVVSATGNVSAGNLVTSGATETDTLTVANNVSAGTTIDATGNISGGNLVTSGTVDAETLEANTSITAGTTVSATGNVSGGNITTSGTTQTGSLSANTTVSATGNVSGSNLTTAGTTQTGSLSANTTVSATGNVSGGNLNTAGTTQTGSLSANTTVSATGNVSGGNITTAGVVDATGNVSGDSLNASTSVVAPNVQVSSATANEVFFTDANSELRTDANLTFDTTNLELNGKLAVDNIIVDDNTISSPANVDVVVDASGTGTFYIDRDTTVSGNLSILGTTTTVNSTETAIEDPILQLGRGANNDPLTTSDGKDRGIAMYYFDAEEKIAFMGYDDPSDEWRFFVDATITDEEVVGTLGDINVGGITTTSVDSSGNISGANLSTTGELSVTGNVSGGNLNTAGTTQTGSLSANTTVSATGNVSGGTLNTAGTTQTGSLSANTTITATGNVSGGNITTAGTVDATGNVSGGNLVTSGALDADTVTAANSVTAGTTVTATGNVSGGNLNTAGTTQTGSLSANTTVSATGNVSGGNLNTAGTTQTGSLSANTTVSATGNVNGGNLVTSGALDADTVTAANSVTAGTTVTATGNVSGGNVTTAGTVDATGNVSGGNLVTSGTVDAETLEANSSITAGTTVTATGNVSGGNLNTAGTTQTGSLSANTTVSATGNVLGGNLVTSGVTDTGSLTSSTTVTATGNVSGGNITTAGTVDATGNVLGGNLVTSGVTDTGSLTASTTVTATGNVSGGNITTAGVVDATGNVSGGNLVTSGALDAETVIANTSVTSPLVTSTADIDITSGANSNINLNPDGSGEVVLSDQAGDRMLFTAANSEISTTANASFDGENLDIVGSLGVDNVLIDDEEIRSLGTELIFNRTNGDVDFVVSGNANPNVFVVDSGTDSVGIGSGNVVNGALLTLDSNSSMVLPSGTTTERPSTPAEGMFRYNSTEGDVEYYDGSEWIAAGTVFTVIESETFSGDGVTTSYTLNDDSTTAGAIVTINGVVQLPSTAYAISGTTLTFTEAPESGDEIEVRRLTTTTTVTSLTNADTTAVLTAQDNAERFNITGNLIPSADITYDLGEPSNRWNDLFLSGNTIALGNITIKDVGSGSVGFFQADGVTPATLDASADIVADEIASGNSSVSFASGGGNALVSIGGNANVAEFSSSGLTITGSIEATNGFVGLDATTIEDGTSSISVDSTDGDITANVAGSTVATFNTSGISAELTGNVTGQVSDISNHSTTDLSEGTNLYYTDTRARNALSASGDLTYNSTTGELSFTERTDSEVRNLLSASGDLSYNSTTGEFSVITYKSSDFDTDFGGKSTTDLSEGTNLYYTDTRARNALSASGDLSYDSTIGEFSFTERTDSEVRNLLSASGDLSYSSTTGEFSITTYKSSDFDTDFGGKSTTDLSEGTNLYYTDTRVDSHLSGGTGVTYSTGSISIGQSVGTTDAVSFDSVTLGSDPSAALQAATKQYVDTLSAASLHYHDPVRVEAEFGLNATYDNGSSGVGATLTNAGTQEALVIDGVTLNNGDRVLVYEQTDATENGIYTVTDTGSTTTNWVLTRSTDTDTYGQSDPDALGQGDAFFVQEGDEGAGELYVMATEEAITFGTTNIKFSQVSSATVYSGGSAISIDGSIISHSDTSTQSSVNNSGGTVIQDVTLDTFGHITGLSSKSLNTGDISESGNLYYTDTRARNALSASGDLSYSSTTGEFSVTTYKSSDFDTDFSGKSTTDLSEGTNLYYTDTRARNALSASGDLSYDTATGTFSVTTYKDSDVESYLSGGSGINFSNGTISHTDTSSQGSVDNGGLTVIQDVTLDTFGHITGLGSKTITRTDLGIDSNDNVSFGTITVPSIDKSGTDGVGNIGSSTNSFDTVHAKATSAEYADLAEMYLADASYEPGTVVAFGGTEEVTISDAESDSRIAGIISTNPSYLMNSNIEGEFTVAVALTGRVPAKVVGTVRKGDMMVSNGDGTARAEPNPSIGTVIGKALEDFDGTEGVIEVVVGRL